MAITSPEFAEQYSLQIYSRELSESAILQEAPDGEMRVLVIVDPDEDTERARVTPEALAQLQTANRYR